MIEIEILSSRLKLPTSCREIKLSDYIEFDALHKKFIECYNEGLLDLAYKNAIDALKCVIKELDDDLALELTLGDYTDKSKKDTIAGMMHLIYSTVLSYEICIPTEEGYKFEYDGREWFVPMFKDFDGNINPKLKYGQYIEALETIRVCADKIEDPSVQFTQYLRVLSSIVREYGKERDETALEMRKMADEGAKYFKDIDMQTGLDAYFFLGVTIFN